MEDLFISLSKKGRLKNNLAGCEQKTKKNTKIPLAVIVGPTASGKTRLAVMLAKKLQGEIVSADSMQIYRHLDIATAKPSLDEMEGVRHYMIDILEPTQNFSVAQYVDMAEGCVQGIHQKGLLPILTGGTGLYIDSLVDYIRFAEEDSGQTEIRKELYRRVETEGSPALLGELQQVDPEYASGVHPNNVKRIVRALEVYYLTGKSFTQRQRESRSESSPFQACWIGLDYTDRSILYDRINRRVDRMVEQGLPDEARLVLQSFHGGTALGAIGYKEFIPWIEGNCSLEESIERLKINTRRYAKRQLTWFRRNPRIRWLMVDRYSEEELLEISAEYLVETLPLCYHK
jgi:tRNA dimethylallyltransferase